MGLRDDLAAAETELLLANDEINRERAEARVREIETQLLLADGLTKAQLRNIDNEETV